MATGDAKKVQCPCCLGSGRSRPAKLSVSALYVTATRLYRKKWLIGFWRCRQGACPAAWLDGALACNRVLIELRHADNA